MKLDEALKLLKKNKVPDWMYSIQELGCGENIGIEGSGSNWIVFYSERGSKNDQSTFSTEDTACDNFLERINKYLISSGRPELH
jgi:hypothetical protein